MNRDRLLRLRDVVMPRIKDEEFDMQHWKCGTTACALGHMCMDREAINEGLFLHYDPRAPIERFQFVPYFEGQTEFAAAMRYFDISMDEAEHMFYPEMYSTFKITRKMVIEHINHVLEGRVPVENEP